MYTLYYFPGNASLMPHMLLREIGGPFALSLVDRANSAQKSDVSQAQSHRHDPGAGP